MNLLSTAFAFIFIAIVALASFWLKEEVINEYKNFTLSKNSGPSFFLKDFDSTKTDEDGNLQSSLQADNQCRNCRQPSQKYVTRFNSLRLDVARYGWYYFCKKTAC